MSAPNPTTADPGTVIFYDLKCATPNTCWSPHCWKARLALQYKHVPFRTVWVSYPDIKPLLGHTQPEAKTVTLPVIQHGQTWVFDSWEIVRYLEAHFPTPSLLPNPQSAHFFKLYNDTVLVESVWNLFAPRVANILDERGKVFFVRTREEDLGMKLEDVGRGETVDQIRRPLGVVARNLAQFGPYLAGEEVTYPDLVLLSTLLWFQRANPVDTETILDMFPSSNVSRAPIVREWFDRVKGLGVVQEEPAE
ncbi:hypothetical protein DACRYDRAFT_119234 [Dacryopinax primogenitus]|uniref:GST C-terminal domain-containing protein n=1 Tax=Dacryopinax primogenitus (strain DJM 731) TaxID=1858805 RepID=M5G1B0_DACPD|nr:uncharacterized protein DACRYDRAFT_119234 [Dacryopinax primogenitus]EJT97552.1 hypothetical protein DACRYDRAFT_119234 [Dacryopinax primogenitus]